MEAPLKLVIISAAAISGLLLSCSAAWADNPSPISGSAQDRQLEVRAASAALDHNWDLEVALEAQAYRGSPSLENEFNLASGYQHTGRAALAIPLYQNVVAHGQFTSGQALYDYRHGATPPPRDRYNLTDEAQRRIDQIAGE